MTKLINITPHTFMYKQLVIPPGYTLFPEEYPKAAKALEQFIFDFIVGDNSAKI